MHIPVICLTGGPCGGKSTILSYLQQKLGDYGFTVITASEGATQLILSGVTPTKVGERFQKYLLRNIIEKEDHLREIAQGMIEEKVVIICDRGTMDVAAYISQHQFDLLLAEVNKSVVELRDKRYDAVLFLRSVAVDKPELYTLVNNKARTETVEEAKKLDETTLAVWTGHSHLKIVDNEQDLQHKMSSALKAICRVLGIPEPLEIEKKYLVGAFSLSDLPSTTQKVDIVQYYLKSNLPNSVERIRARSQWGATAFYYTVKQDIRPGVRIEEEWQITSDEYTKALRKVDQDFARIEKTRYCFVWQNQYFELDVFGKPNGLCLLEIELTEEKETVALPPFLGTDLVDVTDNPRYSNREIARLYSHKISK